MMKIPLSIGDIELVELLARGSAGEVWRGVHRVHEYPVAIKLMAPTYADSAAYAEIRAEFEHDIQTMAILSHPGIVSVYDFGVIKEQHPSHVPSTPVLAMELADQSCGELDSISCWESLRNLLLQILDALSYIHAKGIIHCDLKPENILRFTAPPAHVGDSDSPIYKLTDFGIAHILQNTERTHSTPHSNSSPAPVNASGRNNQENIYRGSPEYSAPEQILGDRHRFGPWTDLYALGCLAYEFATGAPPFVEPNFFKLTMRHLNAQPAPLHPRFELPPGFDAWVLRLLEKDPAHRYRRATDAAAALRKLPAHYASFDPIAAKPFTDLQAPGWIHPGR